MSFAQTFTNADLNAPAFDGTAGSLIALLDACLVNGYTPASLSSIYFSGTTGYAVLSSPDTTLRVGDHVTFAGADQSEINAAFAITVVIDSSNFNFELASPPGSVTGTLTYAKSGLGWSKLFTGTNRAVYQSQDATSNQLCLYVDDNGGAVQGALQATVWGAESFSDINTPTNRFPLSTDKDLCWYKSASADSTPAPFVVHADSKTVYLFIGNNSGNGAAPYGFGHCIPFTPTDAFNTFISGSTDFSSSTTSSDGSLGVSVGGTVWTSVTSNGYADATYLARPVAQAGNPMPANIYDSGGVVLFTDAIPQTSGGGSISSGYGATSPIDYASYPDAGLFILQRLLFDTGTDGMPPRARLPGYYAPWHDHPLSDGDVITDVVGFSGRPMRAVTTVAGGHAGQAVMDMFGPWE